MAASPQQLAAAMDVFAAHLIRCGSPDVIEILGDVDLSMTQVKMLMLLEEPGELSVKEIAHALHLSLPAVSRAIDGLAQRGLVDRREAESDRRMKLVSLRPGGQQIGTAIAASRRATYENFAAGLSEEERSALHAALLPIVERIRRS
jgi:MarR family transcriptional regulator, lower aerobic nicotinate degradation pathway regulator